MDPSVPPPPEDARGTADTARQGAPRRRRSWLWRTAVVANVAFAVLLAINVVYVGAIWEVQGHRCLFGDPSGCRAQMLFFSSLVIVTVWVVVDVVLGALALVRHLARRS